MTTPHAAPRSTTSYEVICVGIGRGRERPPGCRGRAAPPRPRRRSTRSRSAGRSRRRRPWPRVPSAMTHSATPCAQRRTSRTCSPRRCGRASRPCRRRWAARLASGTAGVSSTRRPRCRIAQRASSTAAWAGGLGTAVRWYRGPSARLGGAGTDERREHVAGTAPTTRATSAGRRRRPSSSSARRARARRSCASSSTRTRASRAARRPTSCATSGSIVGRHWDLVGTLRLRARLVARAICAASTTGFQAEVLARSRQGALGREGPDLHAPPRPHRRALPRRALRPSAARRP